jgi:hypothetical protein
MRTSLGGLSMPEYDGFLMRDSLDDTGVTPSPGFPYHSPDIIACPQVSDPTSTFTSNYASDPNEPVQLGSRLNPVYVRAKNLSSNPLNGYYISVFRASPSLFMTPSIWRNNPLSTVDGATSLPLQATVPSGGIGVGQGNFVLDAISSNLFCCVGIASPTPQPTIPADFSTYGDYVVWVRTNQNTCGRNITQVQDYPNRIFERLDSFSNPSQTDAVPTLFQVAVNGDLPADSVFGLECAPLNVSTNWNISAGKVQTASGITPPNFNGTVTTWAQLPTGATWPPNTSIETTVYVGIPSEHRAAAFATPVEELGIRRDRVAGLGNGVLVRVGNCLTSFVSS